MNKTFRYKYKRYVYEWTDYFEHEIKAKNITEAYIKIFAEHNGLSFEEAKESIEENLGKVWLLQSAIQCLNPLGSSDIALYRIDEIRQI